MEHIDEIGLKQHFYDKIHRREVEILKCQAIEKNFRSQQLLAPDVHRVFGEVERITQRDIAGGQLDLRRKSLLGTGREHDSAMSADAQFEVTEETRVVVKKSDVGRAGWIDIARDIGGAERLAIDQGETVHLGRLSLLECKARLRIRRGNLDQGCIW